jgi:hypothetical protein
MATFNKSMANDYAGFVIPLALQNPMLLYATLARSTMAFQGTSLPLPDEGMGGGAVVKKRKPNYDFLHFKHEAIRHLNKQLRNPNLGGVNSTAFYTIVFMLRLEASKIFFVPSCRCPTSYKSI